MDNEVRSDEGESGVFESRAFERVVAMWYGNLTLAAQSLGIDVETLQAFLEGC